MPLRDSAPGAWGHVDFMTWCQLSRELQPHMGALQACLQAARLDGSRAMGLRADEVCPVMATTSTCDAWHAEQRACTPYGWMYMGSPRGNISVCACMQHDELPMRIYGPLCSISTFRGCQRMPCVHESRIP